VAGEIRLTTPLSDEDVEKLNAGDQVLLSGALLTGRDAAHKRLCDLLDKGEELPIDVRGQVIYFVGPSPAKPGKPIGSAGPTTSYRMDPYSPRLIERGLKGMVGKGSRGQEVIDAMVKHKCVYFAATGGAAAYLAKTVSSAEIIAYEDLGPEAIRKLMVEDFPMVVVNDCHGRDLYKEGRKQYERS
jgi:fumarate hydratase subunit beta